MILISNSLPADGITYVSYPPYPRAGGTVGVLDVRTPLPCCHNKVFYVFSCVDAPCKYVIHMWTPLPQTCGTGYVAS